MTVGALPITMAPAGGGHSVATEMGWATPFSCASKTPRGGVATSGFTLSTFVGKSNFTPVTNTYDTGTSVTETAPAGATSVTIELWGGGGGGARDWVSGNASGAASGGYVKHVMAVTGGSTSFTYSVGAAGVGKITTNGNGTNGGTSSIVSPSLSAGGGAAGNLTLASTGGAASGGNTTNTAGNGSALGLGAGKGAPNGGGDSGSAGTVPGGGGKSTYITFNGYNGAAGRIKFAYT